MSTISLVGTLLMFGLLILLGSCLPPLPPRITEFVVEPRNTCAHVPVGVTWTYDGDAATLTSNPHTNTPGGDVPGGHIHAGFNFDTAGTDTTFTLTARRGSQTVTSTPMTAHILPNPFITTIELTYNCAAGAWEHPEFSFQDFAAQITIQSFTNMSPQPLLLELRGQVTELPVGRPAPVSRCRGATRR